MNEQIAVEVSAAPVSDVHDVRVGGAVTPSGGCSCGSAEQPVGAKAVRAAAPPAYVYAIGKVEARFPNIAVEKEFAQATGRLDTAGKTDQQTFHKVLSDRENRYLLRQLCWVLTIQGLDSYILVPRESADMDLLIEAIRPNPDAMDIDVVIGLRGPIAPQAMCNGLTVPLVAFDQIYSFDRAALVKAIPTPEEATAAQFGPAAAELFGRIMQMTDNAGASDEHRALNYLAMRYPAIYNKTAEQFGRDYSLTGVEVRPSPLRGTRKIVDAIFVYANRNTDFTEKFSVRVDVTDVFPFLVTKLSSYYDR